MITDGYMRDKGGHGGGLTIFGRENLFLAIFESQIKNLKLASGGQGLL
jgi:hypothetical protein